MKDNVAHSGQGALSLQNEDDQPTGSDCPSQPRMVSALSVQQHMSTDNWSLFHHLASVLQQDCVNDHFRTRMSAEWCASPLSGGMTPFPIGGEGALRHMHVHFNTCVGGFL